MWEWQLTGSEVAEVRQQGGRLSLHLSAVTARAVGTLEVGTPGGWGYALGVMLDLHHAQLLQCDEHALGRIAEGQLRQDGQLLENIPLPAVRMFARGLELRFANGALLRATGQAWQCLFLGEPRFRESYAC